MKCSPRPGPEAETGERNGNEVSEGHRLPEWEEGEDVVRKVPHLRVGQPRKGGPEAPQRADLPQSGQSEVEGRTTVAGDDPQGLRDPR